VEPPSTAGFARSLHLRRRPGGFATRKRFFRTMGEKAQRVMAAMLKMKKIDIAELERAAA
jgi:hypothetical protein